MQSYFSIIAKTQLEIPSAIALAARITNIHPQYSISLQNNRLIVLCSAQGTPGHNIYRMHKDAGIILGTVFRKTAQNIGERVPYIIEEPETAAFQHSRGKHLITDHWGRYVAFMSDIALQNCSMVTALVDPSGVTRAYYYNGNRYVLIFSEAEHFASLGLTDLKFNRDQIAFNLKYGELATTQTGIRQIGRILPGQALHVDDNGDVTKDNYWRYSSFIHCSDFYDPHDAASHLRTILTGCIHAWASEYSNILLQLSGGLDSSIVLACLATAPNRPTINCINYYKPQTSSDERHLARLMAKMYNVELLEFEQDERAIVPDAMYNLPLQPDAGFCIPMIETDHIIDNLFTKYQIDSLFDGEGGDGLFYQGAMGCIEDFVSRHGLCTSLFRQAILYGRLTRRSVWEILALALKSTFRDPLVEFSDHMQKMLGVNLIMPDSLHEDVDIMDQFGEWLRDLGGAPAAKIIHALAVKDAVAAYHLSSRRRYYPATRPIYSQPFIEAALAIPTYLFSWGGIDRGLERLAFREMLPEQIVNRQSKGAVGRFRLDGLRRHQTKMTSMLRNGVLAEMGLIDPVKIRKIEEAGMHGKDFSSAVLGIMHHEYWARRWSIEFGTTI